MSKLPTEPSRVVVQKMGSYIVRYRGRAFFTFMVYVLSSVMGAVVPLQIGATVDDVVAGKYAQFPWKPILIILAATVAQAIVMLLAMYSAARLGALVTRQASIDTIDATLDLDARTVEESGSGDLLTRVTDDLSSASNAVSFDLLEILFVILYFVVSMVSLAALSIPLSVIFLPMIIGLGLLMGYFLPRLARENQSVQEITSELNSVLTENVRGASTIRELGVHDARNETFEADNDRRYRATLKMVRIRQNYYTLDALNAWFPTVICLLWGSFCVMQGWATWGALATASIMVFSLRTMADILGHHVGNIRIMLVNMGRVFGIINLAQAQRARRKDIRRAQHHETLGNTAHVIECSHVSYGYSSDALVLTDINLKIAPGECLALVGRSGSGKTTLARLIGGSLSALDGTIRVLGKPVGNGEFPTDKYEDGRPRLLVCTQEAHIFFGTVIDNFTAVVPEATEKQIGEALDAVSARWWRELPQGLKTRIGTGEHELTRDQIQQLALARIVAANPHAVILDESTTQLELVDATESLQAVLANRAVLIISHDARIASLADRAVLLQEGMITAEGTPAEIFALT